MNKSTKRRFWIFVIVPVLALLAGMSSLPANAARALLDEGDIIVLLMRFRNEIMLPSPAGRYYDAMLQKHSNELGQLFESHPEHIEKAIEVIQEFAPGMEALLDGKGDTVHITSEQIQLLKEEVDWLASSGSLSLRRDIERELERYPLEHFIGMTMSEAWEYITINFPPDLMVEPVVPDPTVTPQVIFTPICLVGLDITCQEKPSWVPDSNGEWAYYVHNDIYFEYPGDWQVQFSHYPNSYSDNFPLLRLPESATGGTIQSITFNFLWLQNFSPEEVNQVPSSALSQQGRGCTEQWEIVHTPDFDGIECFWKIADSPAGIFYFLLSNGDQRVAVEFWANVHDERLLLESTDDLNVANEILPEIQHIVESIRFEKP